MALINEIEKLDGKERQQLFNDFIKLLNKKREYHEIPERIVCSACQVFVDERDGTLENGDYIIHEVYGLRHYDSFMNKQIKELEKMYKGRFVGREEAMKIAKEQNQIIRLSGSPNSDILFSEDLY